MTAEETADIVIIGFGAAGAAAAITAYDLGAKLSGSGSSKARMQA